MDLHCRYKMQYRSFQKVWVLLMIMIVFMLIQHVVIQSDQQYIAGAGPPPIMVVTNQTLIDRLFYQLGKYCSMSSNPRRIFYNRVPKCGSTTTLRLFENLAKKNSINYVSSKEYRTYILNSTDQKEEFINSFLSYKSPMIFNRHLNFLDFTNNGHENPIYINLLRDPTSTFISRYYFDRFKSGNRHLFKETHNLTLPRCLRENHAPCVGNGTVTHTNFFCGQHEFCKTESAAALDLAKQNLDRYLVVGILERYEDFLYVLECLLPCYFEGLMDTFKGMPQKKKNTTRKRHLSKKDVELLRNRLHKQYEFYHYAERQFQKVYERVLKICPR